MKDFNLPRCVPPSSSMRPYTEDIRLILGFVNTNAHTVNVVTWSSINSEMQSQSFSALAQKFSLPTVLASLWLFQFFPIILASLILTNGFSVGAILHAVYQFRIKFVLELKNMFHRSRIILIYWICLHVFNPI